MEGSYALVMMYVDILLFGDTKHVSDSVKPLVSFVLISVDSNSNCRKSLLMTLKSIYKVDFLHNDI
jgi:hypothetical protein